jgi:hypothetical protein
LKGIKFASRTGEKNTTLCNGRKSYQSRIWIWYKISMALSYSC